MKGVVFNVVEEVVTDEFSSDLWDDVIEHADVEGAYTSLGSYPDSELLRIVGAISEIGGVATRDVLRLAGRRGFRHLAGRHLELVDPYDNWRDLLSALDTIIHPEVQKTYPDTDVPRFDAFPDTPPGTGMLLHYRSARQLCALAEGLILGTGDWFSVELQIEQTSCVAHGDELCRLRIDEAS